MSELNQLLDDIKDGKDIVDDEEDKEVESSLEDLKSSQEISMNTKSIPYKSISEESITKFGKLFDSHNLSLSTESMEKVDKVLVLEAMAGMIGSEKSMISAKLTTAPSVINKSILNSILKEDEEVLNTDLDEATRLLVGSLEDYLEMILDTSKEVSKLMDEINSKMTDKNPIILYKKESLNLLTSNVINISYVNGDELGYDKYSGEALSSKYLDIVTTADRHSSELGLRNEDESIREYSIVDLVERLTIKVDQFVVVCDDIVRDVKVLKEGSFVDASDRYSLIERTNAHMETYNTMVSLLENSPNIFESIITVLDFID